MQRSRFLPVLSALMTVASIAGAQPQARAPVTTAIWSVDTGDSSIAYTIHHPLHTSVGTSKQVVGKVALSSDGSFLVQVMAPVASFDSGSSGRDEHMQETTEATKFPNVTFRARGKLTVPVQYPATVNMTLSGDLDFHGRRHQESIPIQVAFDSPQEAHVASSFTISLDKYDIERPSLLLMKIDDACKIEIHLRVKR